MPGDGETIAVSSRLNAPELWALRSGPKTYCQPSAEDAEFPAIVSLYRPAVVPVPADAIPPP